MVSIMWLQVVTIVLLVPAVLACLYYLGLAFVGLAVRPAVRPPGKQARHWFALVIPAHDEEKTIGQVLQSCTDLDYPLGWFEVFVIADNCSDRTAVVAREWGACCLERVEPQRRGKGHALAWGLPQVLATRPDAK